jgi:hypothetical protein
MADVSNSHADAVAYLQSEHRALLAQHWALWSSFKALSEGTVDYAAHAAYRATLREQRLAISNHTLALRLLHMFARAAPTPLGVA